MDVVGSLKQIEAILRHFSLEQLVDIVIPDLQILSWHNIKQQIIQEQLPLNKDSVIKTVVFAVKQHVTRNENNTAEILQLIRLHDIAVHHYRYKWNAFMMSGETKRGNRKSYSTCSEIQDSIETIFDRKRRLVEVAVIFQEELYFINITERKRIGNGRTIYKAPIFVAHFPGQPYFFISQSGKNEDTLHVISMALGYAGAKDCNLFGQNIRHLFILLKNQESGAASAQDVLQGVGDYTYAMFEETEKGMDFTQHNARLEFADLCFGTEMSLQHVTVKFREQEAFAQIKVREVGRVWKQRNIVFLQKCICGNSPVSRGIVTVQDPIAGAPLLRAMSAHSVAEALQNCFVEFLIRRLSSKDVVMMN